METKPVRFVVVGCGHIGKRHLEMIRRNEHSVLVAMVDKRNPEELGLMQPLEAPFFHSLEAFRSSGIVADVAVIATPNGLHAGHAVKCLDLKMHVVVEKPVALTRSDAEILLYKSLSVNKQVFSVMQNRYSPPSEWLKELVENNVLGNIYMVQINCYWNRDERYYKPGNWHGTKVYDGGTLFTQFSHFIDIMYWVFGDIRDIRSSFQCHNHAHLTEFEDSGMISFGFVNGGMGNFNFTTSVWDRNLESSMTVIAEHGALKIGGQYMNEIEYCHVKDYTMPVLPPTNPANDYGAYKGSAANHHYVIENVVDVLRGKASITTNALEGLKVVDIIERMYQAGLKEEPVSVSGMEPRKRKEMLQLS